VLHHFNVGEVGGQIWSVLWKRNFEHFVEMRDRVFRVRVSGFDKHVCVGESWQARL